MASQFHQADYYNHLAKVGRAGFALLEENNLIRRPKKPENRHPQPPQPHDFSRHPQHYNNHQYEHRQPVGYIYRDPQIYTVLKEPVIDSYQAAAIFGGMLVVDHRIRKVTPKGGY